MTEDLILNLRGDPEYIGGIFFTVFIDRLVVDGRRKLKWRWENQLQGSAGICDNLGRFAAPW